MKKIIIGAIIMFSLFTLAPFLIDQFTGPKKGKK